MLIDLLAAALALTLHAADFEDVVGKNPLALRIAKVESELCSSLCPPAPPQPTSDWLRSEEGRKVNACSLGCRVDQPAAVLFRQLSELATTKTFDAQSPAAKALGKDGPELMRRLRAALRGADGKRLGALCARARRSLTPTDEVVYLDCTGRSPSPDAPGALPLPDSQRAPRCAAAFAERELEWVARCTAIEARIDIGACAAEQSLEAGQRRRITPAAREKCENDAVERLLAAFRVRR